MQLLSDFVDAVRAKGLDALRNGSKLAGVHSGAQVKFSVLRAAFGID